MWRYAELWSLAYRWSKDLFWGRILRFCRKKKKNAKIHTFHSLCQHLNDGPYRPHGIIKTDKLRTGVLCGRRSVAYFSGILLDGQDIALYYKTYIVDARVGGLVRSGCFPGGGQYLQFSRGFLRGIRKECRLVLTTGKIREINSCDLYL